MHKYKSCQQALACALFALLPFAAQAQWEKVNAPYYPGLNQVLRAGDALVATVAGEVFRSTDDGDSWQKVFEGNTLIHNPLDNGLYVQSNGGFEVFGSTDGGLTWQYKFSPQVFGQLVPGFNQDTIFIAGAYALARKTVAGWDTVFQVPPAECYLVEAARTREHLWIATGSTAYHSPDLGETWEQLPFSSNDLAVLGDTVLFGLCISDSYLFRTTDLGATWQADTFANPRFCQISATEDAFFSINSGSGDYNIYTSQNGLTDWDTLYVDSLRFIPHSFREINGNLILASSRGLPKRVNDHWTFQQFPRNETFISASQHKLLYYLDNYLLSVYPLNGQSDDGGLTWVTSAISQMPIFLQRFGNEYIGFGSYPDQNFYKCAADGHFEWQKSLLPFIPRSIASVGDTIYITENSTLGTMLLQRSVDGGATWTAVGPIYIRDIFELDGRLLQVGQNGLLSTSNGGATWETVLDFGFPASGIDHLQVENGQIYLANSSLKRVLHSADGGATFDTLAMPPPATMGAFFAFRAIGKWNFLTAFNDTLYVKEAADANWLLLPLPFPSGEVTNIFYRLAANDSTFFFPGTHGDIWRLDVSQLGQARGCVFWDANANGARDAGESGVQNVLVKSLETGFYGVTNADGEFKITNNRPSDLLQPLTVFPNFAYAPPQAEAQLFDDTLTCFALQAIDNVNDMSVYLAATGGFRPGFDNQVFVTVANNGTTTQSGSVQLVLDPLLDVLSVEPPASSIVGDTIFWEFADLAPLSAPLVFRANLQTGQALPGAPISLKGLVAIPDDLHLSDNEDLLTDIVVASFDPNDKMVQPAQLPEASLDEAELRYTVRFQNLGNIPTDFVTVRDTLPLLAEPESIQILGASHPFEWSLERTNVLIFKFKPLFLPPASVDEPGSHGFVQFSLRLKNGATLGDTISNTAHIYFDFNPAIVTNAAHAVVGNVSSIISTPISWGEVNIFPNPTTGVLRVEANSLEVAEGTLRLFDASGHLAFSQKTAQNKVELNLPPLPNGRYELLWQIGERVFSGKLNLIRN
jgi:photosystem II stability/assembly factor-like uncharacterized protein